MEEIKPTTPITKSSRSKRTVKTVGYGDFFMRYPYKCSRINPNSKTVPQPYIPKDKIDCDHDYSVEYKMYKAILQAYLRGVIRFIRDGGIYKMPAKMGFIRFFRFSGPVSDRELMAKRGVEIKSKRHHINGDRIGLEWNKKKSSRFPYYRFWMMHTTRAAWKELVREYYESNINKMALIEKR